MPAAPKAVATTNGNLKSVTWTDQQKAIFQWVYEGRGHGIALARAGTGKTSTAIEAIRHMLAAGGRTTTAVIVMFNQGIAKETEAKLGESGIRAWSKTFHAAGWQALRTAVNGIKMTGYGPGGAGFHKWETISNILEIPEVHQKFTRKAVGLAKQRAFGVACKLSDPAEWLKLVDDFGLDQMIAAEYLESGLRTRDAIIREALQWSYKALRLSNEMLLKDREGKRWACPVADFDDQIYAPLILDIRMLESDWLIVDEAQDSNPARRLLARKMLKANGRSLWIGDDFQAIYLFTGADSAAMSDIQRDWNAQEFKLTKTFRCPKVAVALAKELVEDYEAADSNPVGEYFNMPTDEFFNRGHAKNLTPDSIILCRNMAPLVRAAFKLIALDVPCQVMGKNIGEDLLDLVTQYKTKSLRTLRERLDRYREAQTVKLTKAKKPEQIDALNDRIETIFAIMENLPTGSDVGTLEAKIEALFEKPKAGCDPVKRVRLMTLHRSKGLEAPTVVFMGRQELIPSKYAYSPEQIQQEYNLAYVGLTRVQKTLFEIGTL